MAVRRRDIRLAAPYLKRIALDTALVKDAGQYPFCLPLFKDGFELAFGKAITIIAGENGTGKSTLREVSGAVLAEALKASWLPKLSDGWFFRAESFFSVARYLDAAGSASADFLSLFPRRRIFALF